MFMVCLVNLMWNVDEACIYMDSQILHLGKYAYICKCHKHILPFMHVQEWLISAMLSLKMFSFLSLVIIKQVVVWNEFHWWFLLFWEKIWMVFFHMDVYYSIQYFSFFFAFLKSWRHPMVLTTGWQTKCYILSYNFIFV